MSYGGKKEETFSLASRFFSVLTVLGRGRHLVSGYLRLLPSQKRYATALLRRQTRTHHRLHHVDAVRVHVRLAAAAPDTLAAVAAQNLTARVARRDLTIRVLAPGVSAFGLEALPARSDQSFFFIHSLRGLEEA